VVDRRVDRDLRYNRSLDNGDRDRLGLVRTDMHTRKKIKLGLAGVAVFIAATLGAWLWLFVTRPG
jgi:hypothetical protein